MTTCSRTSATRSDSISTLVISLDQLVVGPDRLDDRRPGSARLEVLEAKVVAKHVGDPALEHVELGERVLADREQEVDAKIRAC